MTASLTNAGTGFIGEVPWGSHILLFFETSDDLLETLLPFMKAGLEANEFCLWVVPEPLTEEEARNALGRFVPDLLRHLALGSIEIHAARDWYTKAGVLDLRGLIDAWDGKLAEALRRGFAGMRANASAAWLQEKDWRDFAEYEEKLNEWMAGKRMIVACSYPLAAVGAARILDVARTHGFAVAKRNGTWDIVETPSYREAKAQIERLNEGLKQRVAERTAELEQANLALATRHQRQRAVADLGQEAIRAVGLTELMDKAAAVAAETLGSDFSTVAALLADRNEFRLVSGVGWKDGLVGTILSAAGTPGRYMLSSDEPLLVSDLRSDARFEQRQYLLDQGILSVAAVIIRGRARPWGLLSVHSTRKDAFGSGEVSFLQSLANVLALAVERHDLEVEQRREKEALAAIFDNSPVMITLYDASGRLLRANREWERTFGWTLEEAQRVDLLAEVYPDPDRLREAREFIQRAERRWAEFRPRMRDGRVIDTLWMRVPLSDGSRVGFALDITERKRAEAERAQLLESERSARAEAEAAFEKLRAIQSITESALARMALEDLLSELLARLRRALGGISLASSS
jgi:PAS domain S-box-containing protein